MTTDETLYAELIDIRGIDDKQAIIEAIEERPEVNRVVDNGDLRGVRVKTEHEAANRDVAHHQMIGILRGQLAHHDIEYEDIFLVCGGESSNEQLSDYTVEENLGRL